MSKTHYWLNTIQPPLLMAYESWVRKCVRRIPLHKLNQEVTGRATTNAINCCSTPPSSSLVTGGSKEVVAAVVKLASYTKPRSRRLRRCQRRDWMPTECVVFKPSHSYDVAYPSYILQPGYVITCQFKSEISEEKCKSDELSYTQLGTCVDPLIQWVLVN